MTTVQLTARFYESLFPLFHWKYDPRTFNENSLPARGLVDKFVYQPLTDEQKELVDRRARTHKMPIPPPLGSVIDIPFVMNRVEEIIQMVASGKSLEEIYSSYSSANGMRLDEFNLLLKQMFKE